GETLSAPNSRLMMAITRSNSTKVTARLQVCDLRGGSAKTITQKGGFSTIETESRNKIQPSMRLRMNFLQKCSRLKSHDNQRLNFGIKKPQVIHLWFER